MSKIYGASDYAVTAGGGMKLETIKAVTAKCERNDCRLSSSGMATSLVNMGDEYGRNGNLIPRSAYPLAESVRCGACGSSWIVKHNPGEAPVVRARVA